MQTLLRIFSLLGAMSRCWSSPVMGCGGVTQCANLPLQLKSGWGSFGILPLRFSRASRLPRGSFSARPAANFQRSHRWLLAAPRRFSLKAGSERLPCFCFIELPFQGPRPLPLLLSLFLVSVSWLQNSPETLAGEPRSFPAASIFVCVFSHPPPLSPLSQSSCYWVC